MQSSTIVGYSLEAAVDEALDTSSQADSSNSGVTESYASVRPTLEETFSTIIISSFKFSFSSIWPHLLPLLTCGLILPIQLFAIGFVPFIQWGDIAHSIHTYGFKSMLTFGFHFISYEGRLALTSIVIALQWIILLFAYLSFKGLLNHPLISKFKDRMKLFTQISTIVLVILNIPIVHLFASFWSCDYTTDSLQSFKLRDFKELDCWSSLNAVYASLSLIHFLVQVFLVVVYYFGIVETEPYTVVTKQQQQGGRFSQWLASKPAILSTKSPLFFTLMSLLVMLFIFYSEVIPNYTTFPYLFPAFSLSIFVGLFVFYCLQLPFYLRIVNSFYGGLLLGYVGQNTLSLIVSVINLEESNVELVSTRGIAIFGSSFGSFIVLFIVGFLSIEIYTRMKVKLISKWSSNVVSYGDEFFVNNETVRDMGERNLELVLQFVLLYNDASVEKKIIKAIIRGAIKQKVEFSNSSIYINLALFLRHTGIDSNDKGNIFLSTQLLKRIHHSKPGIIDRHVCLLRKNENELILQGNAQSINESEKQIIKNLQSLQKKTTKLRELIRSFWKSITNGRISNELISVNREITKWTSLCKDMYENLISNYPTNKMVILSYAQFLEEFLFEKERSKELIHQITIIEEDEHMKSKVNKTPFTNSSSLRMSRNKILPYKSSWSEHESSEDLDLKKKQVDFNGNEDEYLTEEELFAKKQEESYLKAIQRKQSKIQTIFKTVLIPTLSMFMVVAGIVATSIISNSFSKVDHLSGSQLQLYSDMCSSSPYPFYVLSGYRLMQRHFQFNPNQTFADHFMTVEQENFRQYQKFLEDLLKRVSVADKTEFLKLWEFDLIEISMPVITMNFNFNTSAQFVRRNATIKEVLELVEYHTDHAKDFTKKELMQTLENPSFLYLLLNRRQNAYALETFCSNLLDSKISSVQVLKDNFVIGMGAAIGFFLVIGILNVGILMLHFMHQSKLLQLFKDIPKEEAGKIYHSLEKKTLSSRLATHVSSDSKHQNETGQLSNVITPARVLMFSSILIFIMGMVSVSLFLIDINGNLLNQERALKKLYQASKVKVIVNRSIFQLGELMRMNDWKNIFGTMSEFDRIHRDLTRHARDMESFLSSFLNGDENIGFFSMIGINEEMDSFILPANCSRPNQPWTGNNSNYSSLLTNREFFSCLSLSQLMIQYNVHMDFVNQLAYRSIFSNSIVLERYHTTAWEIVKIFNKKFNRTLDIFIVTFSKLSGISLSIGTSVVFFISLLIVLYFISRFTNSYEQENYQLRQQFNYLSWQIIDNIESINTFIVKNKVTKPRNNKIVSDIKLDNQNVSNDTDTLTAVVHSIIDGVIQFNGEGIIEVINPSGLKILGIRVASEVVGKHISSLFISTDKEKIEEKVLLLVNHSSQGEVIELNAKRGHFSTTQLDVRSFPVVVSFSVAEVESQFNRKQKKSLYTALFRDITSEKKSVELLNMEKKKSENLLLNILPNAVATRLKLGETLISEKFDDVTCLFSDMVGFTAFSSKCTPTELIQMLNEIVNGFDDLTTLYRLEKIKTIGDAYFCAGGLYDKESDHPERALQFAIDMYKVLREYNYRNPMTQGSINIRVGLHTGSVVAGVIGTKKFAFDLWGDAVNTASRMESNSIPGRIQISRSTYVRVFDLGYEFEERNIELKGKGMTQCYLLHEKHNGTHLGGADSKDSLNDQE